MYMYIYIRKYLNIIFEVRDIVHEPRHTRDLLLSSLRCFYERRYSHPWARGLNKSISYSLSPNSHFLHLYSRGISVPFELTIVRYPSLTYTSQTSFNSPPHPPVSLSAVIFPRISISFPYPMASNNKYIHNKIDCKIFFTMYYY